MANLLFKDLSGKILKCAFNVHSIIGPGFLEKSYANAMAVEMQLQGIPFKREVPYPHFYKGQRIGDYYADMVVADAIILELKSAQQLVPIMHAQIINYLKVSGLTIGFLINFNAKSLEYKRFYRRL